MAVLLETSKGDMVVDLYTEECPIACKNFLKLCKCASPGPQTAALTLQCHADHQSRPVPDHYLYGGYLFITIHQDVQV